MDQKVVIDRYLLQSAASVIEDLLESAKMEAIQLTPFEALISKLLMAAHVDGMAIGIAASKGLAAPMPSTQSEN